MAIHRIDAALKQAFAGFSERSNSEDEELN